MGTRISSVVQDAIANRDGYMCCNCGHGPLGDNIIEPLGSGWLIRESTERYRQYFMQAIDHVLPVGQRGADDESNLRLYCQDCNLQKAIREGEFPTKKYLGDDFAIQWFQANGPIDLPYIPYHGWVKDYKLIVVRNLPSMYEKAQQNYLSRMRKKFGSKFNFHFLPSKYRILGEEELTW